MYKTIIFQTGFNSQWLVKDHYLSCKRTVCSRGGGGGTLPIMAYIGRLSRKGYLFMLQVYERVGFHKLKYKKG